MGLPATALELDGNELEANGRNLRLKPNGTFDFSAASVTLAAPSGSTDPATKGYVDNLVDGVRYKAPAHAATTAALPAVTYANGTAGVGATLTADANGAFPTIDGVAAGLNQRYVIKNQAAGLQNGLYELTQVGDGSNPFILTRTSDANEDNDVTGMVIPVDNDGTANGGKRFYQDEIDVTMGTTALNFIEWGGSTMTGGDGIDVSGANISVDLATNPGLEFSSAQLRVKAGDGIVLSAGGVGANLDGSGGIEFNSGQMRVKLATNPGISRGASGLSVLLDGGTLALGAGGLKVADGGVDTTQLADGAATSAKLGVQDNQQGFTDANFSDAGGNIYTATVSQTPDTNANVAQRQLLMINGIGLSPSGNPLQKVAGSPAADGQWRLNGTTLEIYSSTDLTSGGDVFLVAYPSAS